MKNIIDTVKNYFSEKELTPEEVAERIEKTQAILDEIKESGIVNELKKLSKEKGRINVYTNSSLVGRHNHSTRLSVDQKEDGNIGLFLEESRQYGSYNEQYGGYNCSFDTYKRNTDGSKKYIVENYFDKILKIKSKLNQKLRWRKIISPKKKEIMEVLS